MDDGFYLLCFINLCKICGFLCKIAEDPENEQLVLVKQNKSLIIITILIPLKASLKNYEFVCLSIPHFYQNIMMFSNPLLLLNST